MRIRCKNTQHGTDEIKMLVFRASLLMVALISLMPSTIIIVEQCETILSYPTLRKIVNLMVTILNVFVTNFVIAFVGLILRFIEEIHHDHHQDQRERLNIWELRLFL